MEIRTRLRAVSRLTFTREFESEFIPVLIRSRVKSDFESFKKKGKKHIGDLVMRNGGTQDDFLNDTYTIIIQYNLVKKPRFVH